MVAIIATACVGLVGYIAYASMTRESVVFKRSNKTLSETMDPMNPKTLKVSATLKLIIKSGHPQPHTPWFSFLLAVNVKSGRYQGSG